MVKKSKTTGTSKHKFVPFCKINIKKQPPFLDFMILLLWICTSPETSFHPPCTCSREGDVDDNWRAGLWWHLPSQGGRGGDCLSTDLISSLDYLSGNDASSTEQLSGKMDVSLSFNEEAHNIQYSMLMCILYVSLLNVYRLVLLLEMWNRCLSSAKQTRLSYR